MLTFWQVHRGQGQHSSSHRDTKRDDNNKITSKVAEERRHLLQWLIFCHLAAHALTMQPINS